MNNSKNSINNVYSFKKVIDDIINANLANKGMVKYVSAKVVGVNSNGTVNVYIPPDNSNIVNGLANKSGEILATGDSVELCTKNGSLKNAWIAVKHGINSAGGATDNFPIGSIIAYGGTEIPNNWLVCDGSAVSRETYKELFEKIGTIYGDGDGSTTFNLPNYGGRVPVGLDKNDTDFDTLGATLGEKKHTLTVSEIPSHYHDLSVHSGGNTSAPISGVANTSNASASGLLTDSRFRIQNTGGGQSHNNIQPSIVANYIIKASNLTGYVKSTQAEVIDNLTNTSTTDALSANMGKKLNDEMTRLKEYSTNETLTGETWIDGTFIYRKVLHFTETSGKFTTGISDMKCLVHAYGTVLFNDVFIPLNFYNEGGFNAFHLIEKGKSIFLQFSNYTPSEWYIILEYTKN